MWTILQCRHRNGLGDPFPETLTTKAAGDEAVPVAASSGTGGGDYRRCFN